MLYNFVKTIQKMNFKTIFFYLCLSLIINIVFLSDDINIESILTLLSIQNLPTLLMCYKVLKIIFIIYIAYFILYEDISTGLSATMEKILVHYILMLIEQEKVVGKIKI